MHLVYVLIFKYKVIGKKKIVKLNNLFKTLMEEKLQIGDLEK